MIRMLQALLTLPMKAIAVPFHFLFHALRHWYAIVLIPAVFAAFYFMGALNNTGIAKDIENFVMPKINGAVEQVQKCEDKMRQPREYFNCIGNWE